MTELQLLDELVPEVHVHGDWEDVMRRARRRRAPVLAVALAVAAVATGSALGIALTRDAGATLPPQADRSNVVVLVQPLTGRVVVKAAPWKGRDGICYVLFSRSGCVLRTARATVVSAPPIVGYTFDRRVAAGSVVTPEGRRVPLIVRRFGGRIEATFFVTRGRLPVMFTTIVLRDREGRVIVRRTMHPR
jgi:hypothetical protein